MEYIICPISTITANCDRHSPILLATSYALHGCQFVAQLTLDDSTDLVNTTMRSKGICPALCGVEWNFLALVGNASIGS